MRANNRKADATERGAQVCAKRKPDEPDKSNGVENINKIKYVQS